MYEMNIQDIAAMINRNLLLQKSMVLVAVITITFVGVSPKKWLKKTFHIWRAVVAWALKVLHSKQWHYHDIKINAEHLQALPKDDVPDKITVGLWQCSDAHQNICKSLRH